MKSICLCMLLLLLGFAACDTVEEVHGPPDSRLVGTGGAVDANISSSPDRFPGAPGAGWATAWQASVVRADVIRSVVNDDPLRDRNNYLVVKQKATAIDGASRIARQYESFGDVDVESDHGIRFDFRLDSADDFTHGDDVIAFSARRDSFAPGATGTNPPDTWGIRARGTSGTWTVFDGPSVTNTKVPLVVGAVYTFELRFDLTDETYGLSIRVDGAEEFRADALSYRNEEPGGPGTYIHVYSRRDTPGQTIRYSFGSVNIFDSRRDPTDVELFHWHDFTVDAPSATGNLFDVLAHVEWTHEHTTTVREGMAYYAGDDQTFAFRFGAEKLGRWTGITSSAVPELDGLKFEVRVVSLTNPRRSGYHVDHRSNPTWWVQQKGPSARPTRIAPRLVMWAAAHQQDLTTMRDLVDKFADDLGFTGAHTGTRGAKWFDFDHTSSPTDFSFNDSPGENPDPRTFEWAEALIDAWLEKGGHVHFWLYGDESRNETSVSMPGGEHGEMAQRLERYFAARLGPVPGWSLGLGFDVGEWTDADGVGAWIDRLGPQLGWFHWLGARIGHPPAIEVRSGEYPQVAVDWNTKTSAPPQYASWEQHWPKIVGRDENTTRRDIVAALSTNTAAGERAIPDRPHFSEDRFRFRAEEVPSQDPLWDFNDTDEVLATIEAYGMAGWATIWGDLRNDGLGVPNQSELWPDIAADLKRLNYAITATLELCIPLVELLLCRARPDELSPAASTWESAFSARLR